MRTQVGIVGAGPSGLLLGRLLQMQGIDSIIVESRSRDYIEARIRAGVMEHWAAELTDAVGLGQRMRREGLVHDGIGISFAGQRRRIDLKGLTGKSITVYGHTDRNGSLRHNTWLSQRRANQVKDALVFRGFAPESIQIVTVADKELAIDQSPGTVEQANRRAVIVFE